IVDPECLAPVLCIQLAEVLKACGFAPDERATDISNDEACIIDIVCRLLLSIKIPYLVWSEPSSRMHWIGTPAHRQFHQWATAAAIPCVSPDDIEVVHAERLAIGVSRWETKLNNTARIRPDHGRGDAGAGGPLPPNDRTRVTNS